MTLPNNSHLADGVKRQRRAPIPAQGKALGADRATAQGLKARPITGCIYEQSHVKLTHCQNYGRKIYTAVPPMHRVPIFGAALCT